MSINIPTIAPEARTLTATIASGQALSAAIATEGMILTGITLHGSAWTSADLALKTSPDNDTYVVTGYYLSTTQSDVYLDFPQFAANTPPYHLNLNPQLTAGILYLKLWSHNGSGVNVNQGATRTFTLYFRRAA